MALLCLDGGGQDGLGEPLGLLHTLGEFSPTEAAGLLILLPHGAEEIPPHDELEGDHFELLHKYSAPLEFRALELRWHVFLVL